MTKPLRRFLLNEQIAIEARRIAHEHTRRCNDSRRYDKLVARGDLQAGEPVPNLDTWHTPSCTKLKLEIENLALQVKLAGIQPAIARREELVEAEPERAGAT